MSEIASICSVPIDFIIMRGQGIKLLSFIAKKCRELNTLMPVLDKAGKGGYEGAICLIPEKGFYSNNPVAVVDYASLYPSSMISENISHDSKVWSKEYDLEGNFIKETGEKNEIGEYIYDNLPNFKYVDIEYDTYDYVLQEGKKKEEKTKVGKKICRYAQFPDNEKAIMPKILTELLGARKATRELIKHKTVEINGAESVSGLVKETDKEYIVKNKTGTHTIKKEDVIKIYDTYNDFMKNVFNQRQLGYKVTANSLYGQCGAKTSAFFEMDIAASTTATGRKLLTYAERVIQEVYKDKIVDTEFGKRKMNANVVYGDTDSCFFTFNFKDLEGNEIDKTEALKLTIKYAIEAGEIASKFLKHPHDLEYEKTFDRFFLLSKKRYVGMLIEHDINKSKRKSMGIVLKRRDNADIVKDVYGGVLDILMKDGDVNKAVRFTKQFLQDIVDGKVDMKKLIISKALRDWYKNPESIAHKVLADRMGKRDPGNKPAVGSRVPYIYIQTKGNVKLQGDRIENPEYIIKNNLKPDYMFYITNQIMKPLQQLFGLILEDIAEFKPQVSRFKRQINSLKRKYTETIKFQAQEEKLRNASVKKLIFNDSLLQANNDKIGQNNIITYMGVKKNNKKCPQQTNKIIKSDPIQTTFANDYKTTLMQQTIQRFLN
jgi:DNA polymerase elongation subunit (family B)